MKKKIGRNAPCPCGSGKKYKKCHGAGGPSISKEDMKAINQLFQESEALEQQRKQQQGLGKPIISIDAMGRRFVAVGKGLLYSEKWKTFHDFLMDYPRYIFDTQWANAEIAKPFESRHPILQWFDMMGRCNAENWKQEAGKVKSAPMIGATAAYLHLSYNLYLLAHNVELHRRLVKRLMNMDQFHGAYYETYVFGALIKAGFSLELEDESDGAADHCECIATYEASGAQYSVEAKARGVRGVLGKNRHQGSPADGEIKIFNKLRDALGKSSEHQRIVFIDTNVPDSHNGLEWEPWMENVLTDLRNFEGSLRVWGQEAPPAYVVVTNFPYHHEPDKDDYRLAVMAEGFKIPDFKVGGTFFSLRDAVIAREKHRDMYELTESMKNMDIPATFDGELPEFAFRESIEPRLLIGKKYMVENPEGEDEPGELESACVLENEKMVYGTYRLDSGRRVICSTPIDDVELAAYRKAPDTFFGVVHSTPRKCETVIDLYDFFIETASKMTPETMLQQLSGHPRYGEFKEMVQGDLAIEYALAYAENAYAQSQKRKRAK